MIGGRTELRGRYPFLFVVSTLNMWRSPTDGEATSTEIGADDGRTRMNKQRNIEVLLSRKEIMDKKGTQQIFRGLQPPNDKHLGTG